jgi:Transposase DDE domain
MPETPQEIPTIQTFRWIWEQQFYPPETGGTFRVDETVVPAGQMYNSPYDLDATYAKKRNTSWVGYKVHFTETCDEQAPHLITQVTTTDGAVTDDTALTDIQEGLERQEVLPEQHLVDTGYVDANLLVTSQKRFGIDLVGPTRGDHKWQARKPPGFDASHFQLDWDKQQAVCPEGQVSMGWMEAYDGDRAVIKVKFSYALCRRCPSHDLCTKSGRRTLTLRPRAEYDARPRSTPTRANRSVCRASCQTSGNRGSSCPSSKALRSATITIHWTAQDTFATGSNCYSPQRIADWSMDDGCPNCQDATATFRVSHGTTRFIKPSLGFRHQ